MYPPTSAHTLHNHLLDGQVIGKRSLNNPQTSAEKSLQPTSYPGVVFLLLTEVSNPL